MESSIVVTSWWSNCLALTALDRLLEFAPGRKLYVMQAGKSDSQIEQFRTHLPKPVEELLYPSHLLADDSPMREYLALEALRASEGVWFFDHDAFLLADAAAWFAAADALFDRHHICLCTRPSRPGSGITQPAYWLSPTRWPRGLSAFDPVPFRAKPYVRRPDLHRHDNELVLPGKDTLVQVREELVTRDMAGTFPPKEGDDPTGHFLPSFPRHFHLGGLHLYTGTTRPTAAMPQAYFDWRRHTVMVFDDFFRNCPPEWLAIEDPELLRRHAEMMQAVEAGS